MHAKLSEPSQREQRNEAHVARPGASSVPALSGASQVGSRLPHWRQTSTNSARLQQLSAMPASQALQKKSTATPPALPAAERSPAAASAQGLPPALKHGMQALSGFSMDQVRVHYHSSAPAQLQALAYAQGQDIYLGPGQESQLPHEAWHVVQQAQGRVPALWQMKGGPSVNDDRGLEAEADRMGAQALTLAGFAGLAAATPLKSLGSNAGNAAPVQGRFGFEIELPILFLAKHDRTIPSREAGKPALEMKDVPCDAAFNRYPTHLDTAPELYVNVDHSLTLNALYSAELEHYAAEKKLDKNGKDSLLAAKERLMPSRASIVEVVTEPWDESTLTRSQALGKINTVITWIEALFRRIEGNRQAPLGDYFIGSNAPHSTLFQPRLGYFHATYGVKLSQVPKLFARTTGQKDRLKEYAVMNEQTEHSNNVMQTYISIGKAWEVLAHIKSVWPVTQEGPFEINPLGWKAGSEEKFLGFINLLTNYFLMFRANNQSGSLLKNALGMHFYKSDLAEVAKHLPGEILSKLKTDPSLRRELATVLGAVVDMKPNDQFGGAMEKKPPGATSSATMDRAPTLEEYLEQIIFANYWLEKAGVFFNDFVLHAAINPYSKALGPDMLGPEGHREMGIVMENRHLEYLDPRYGINQTDVELKRKVEFAKLGALPEAKRSALERAKIGSSGAREEGPARRPMAEWRGIMIGVYDMIKGING
jgi:hypothetical protein